MKTVGALVCLAVSAFVAKALTPPPPPMRCDQLLKNWRERLEGEEIAWEVTVNHQGAEEVRGRMWMAKGGRFRTDIQVQEGARWATVMILACDGNRVTEYDVRKKRATSYQKTIAGGTDDIRMASGAGLWGCLIGSLSYSWFDDPKNPLARLSASANLSRSPRETKERDTLLVGEQAFRWVSYRNGIRRIRTFVLIPTTSVPHEFSPPGGTEWVELEMKKKGGEWIWARK